jgi:hypothetical protein
VAACSSLEKAYDKPQITRKTGLYICLSCAFVASLLEDGENSSVGHKAKQACSFLFQVNETFIDQIQGEIQPSSFIR